MENKIIILISRLPGNEDFPVRGLLGAEDRTRADRFKFPEDRARFLLGRTLLVRALRALGIPLTALDLEFTPLGKPQLRDHPEVHFSITHSGNYVAVAAARGAVVGIDLEHIPPNFDYQAIAERVLSPADQKLISALPVERQLTAFFQAWTGKEAVLKARGTGIAGGMPAVEIPLQPRLTPRALDADWMIQGLPLPDDYMGNVVWNDPARSIDFLDP